jgi:transketolase
MRKAGLSTIYELAQKDSNIIFIGSDLGHGTLEDFSKELPLQFFMEGISEAHLVGMAAGMASCGCKVYINTIATFLTRRCFDQLAIAVCMDKQNVVLYGNGGGLVYGPLGGTHTAIEDIAILSGLPNMTILVPADANEMMDFVRQSHLFNGPLYIRVAKGGDKIVTKLGSTIIGKAKIFGEKSNDLLLCTTGVMLQRALELKSRLKEKNISTQIIHFPTVHPLDKDSLIKYAYNKKVLITIEEHIESGGLGQKIGTLLIESGVHVSSFKRFCLPNQFLSGYGRQEDLLEENGLGVESMYQNILKEVEKL